MTHLEPSFSVNVDVTNPGQFFACCGLLELASRFWPSAEVEAWFGNSAFHLTAPDSGEIVLKSLLGQLQGSDIATDNSRGEHATHPVRLSDFGITLDWWTTERGEKTLLKLWAGQQTPERIITDLRSALAQLTTVVNAADLFDAGMPLTGRFGVDPRAAWNALDVGFSPNEQGMEVLTFPAVELLASVGLQRFRPVQDGNYGFSYATWTIPLRVPVARAASANLIPAGNTQTFRFRIAMRGNYKGFDFATLVGDKHEQ